MFRKNSFFTQTDKEVEYNESVRKHALRLEKDHIQEKGLDVNQVSDIVQDVLDERDSRD